MEIENQNQSVSNGAVILIILSLILTGLHGLISIIFFDDNIEIKYWQRSQR